MVSAVRKGLAVRAVARLFRVDHSVVRKWLKRAGRRRLDRVDFGSQSRAPKTLQRTAAEMEDLILEVRRWLQEESPLGEYGPVAIRRELLARPVERPPAITTIKRILRRRGALDGRRRIRRPAPPPGWYLPAVAAAQAEIDSCDVIEDLKLEAGPLVDVFNVVSIIGKRVRSWPAEAPMSSDFATCALLRHWREHGLPDYVQFDNDTRFTGGSRWPNTLGTLIRTCLALNVTPVFAPPREHGIQNAIESANGRWQAKIWRRFQHPSFAALKRCAATYENAANRKNAASIGNAPTRRRFPKRRTLLLPARPQGTVILIRRTDAHSRVVILGKTYSLPVSWPYRLARCELDLTASRLRFVGLRRQAFDQQPCLHSMPFLLPQKQPLSIKL